MVEPKRKLGKIHAGVFDEAEGMIGTGDRALGVADDRIPPAEFRVLGCGSSRTSNNSGVPDAGIRHRRTDSGQAIGEHLRCIGQGVFAPIADRLAPRFRIVVAPI